MLAAFFDCVISETLVYIFLLYEMLTLPTLPEYSVLIIPASLVNHWHPNIVIAKIPPPSRTTYLLLSYDNRVVDKYL